MTVAGIVSPVREVALMNALAPMLVTPDGIVTVPEHVLPVVSTLLVIVTVPEVEQLTVPLVPLYGPIAAAFAAVVNPIPQSPKAKIAIIAMVRRIFNLLLKFVPTDVNSSGNRIVLTLQNAIFAVSRSPKALVAR